MVVVWCVGKMVDVRGSYILYANPPIVHFSNIKIQILVICLYTLYVYHIVSTKYIFREYCRII